MIGKVGLDRDLASSLYESRAVKWWVAVIVNLNRQSEVGVQSTDAVFRSNLQVSTHTGDIDVQALRADHSSQLDRFTNLGSGWSLNGIDDFTINIARFNSLMGSSHIKTPKFIKVKNAVINLWIRKTNNVFVGQCYLHCIMWNAENIQNVYPNSNNTRIEYSPRNRRRSPPPPFVKVPNHYEP